MEQGTNKKYIGVHAMILQMKDLKRVHERIESLEEFYKEYTASTVESYGLVHFVDKGAKIEGELKNKYPDMRIVEVNSAGVEATPVSHEVPKHQVQLERLEDLEFVKARLITVENLKQAIDFGREECVERQELKMMRSNLIAKRLLLPLRNALQHLVGMNCKVVVHQNKIRFTKNHKVVLEKGCGLSWDWPKRYVSFVATRIQSPSAVFWNIGSKIASEEVFTTTHCHAGAGFVQQFVTADQVEPDAIEKAFRYDGGSVSNFGFSDKPLEWNHFRGFRFIFSIRELQSSAVETAEFMENFKRKGYLNYYNVDPIDLEPKSAVIGYSLIQQLFVNAATHFVSPNPAGIPDFEWINAYLYVCENGHPIAPYIHEALQDKGVKRWTHRKKVIIKHLPLNIYKTLERCGKLNSESAKIAFVNTPAREIIHFTDLFLYKMWNETVNLLIEKRGLKLAVGDLVFVSKEMEEYVNTTQGPSADKSYLEEKSILYESVKVLTQEDLNSGAYTIKDLVIPVCGFDVRWPQNDCGGFIEEVLKKNKCENIEWFSQLKNKSSSLPVIFPGTYRRVINVPENLKWQIREYIDPKVPLVLDDVPLQPPINEIKVSDGNVIEPETKNALIVEFFVPARTNLMTPLREILKMNDFGELSYPFSDSSNVSFYGDKAKLAFNNLKLKIKEAIDNPKTPSSELQEDSSIDHLENADYIQLPTSKPFTRDKQGYGLTKRQKQDQPDSQGQRYFSRDLSEFQSNNSVENGDKTTNDTLWMTQELKIERREVRRMWNEYRKGKLSHEEYKKAMSKYYNRIKSAKKRHFRAIHTNLNREPTASDATNDCLDKANSDSVDLRVAKSKNIQQLNCANTDQFLSNGTLFDHGNSEVAGCLDSSNENCGNTNGNVVGNYGRVYYGDQVEETSIDE